MLVFLQGIAFPMMEMEDFSGGIQAEQNQMIISITSFQTDIASVNGNDLTIASITGPGVFTTLIATGLVNLELDVIIGGILSKSL